ncbi:hypothetical protein [Companilactobacillus zhachilii]|jgi:hypothetical protein|uniref:hypothetical protein n=1 Tax=Companilactobacillus zhachilii TaxID=2304606 RepID=UPI000E7495D3|nr:hypothetical protein [Companilactobacillus zhachilii]
MRKLKNNVIRHPLESIIFESIAAIAFAKLIVSLSIPSNWILVGLMVLMTYTGFRMITTGKIESLMNEFTGLTIAMGIVMVIVFWVKLM